MRPSIAQLALAALPLALAACGGGGTPDPLQPYRTQAVQWTECDPGILGQPSGAMNALRVSPRLRCAQVRAPIDWKNPARGDLSLAVMRLAAGQPKARRGALFFNPGGPGLDGLPVTFRLWDAFADSHPGNPQGAQQLRLLDEYDLVGFSPRGTGASTQLQCGTNEPERPVDFSRPDGTHPSTSPTSTTTAARPPRRAPAIPSRPTSPPTPPRATSTCCAACWATSGCITWAIPTAPGWARGTPACSPSGWAAWCSMA